MSKSIVTGIFGAVSGIVAAIVGILWGIRYVDFVANHDAAVGIQNLPIIQPSLLDRVVQISFFMNIHVSDLQSNLAGLTFILGVLLVLTLILTGVGLYGLGKVEGKSMGTVSLVFGVIGAILAILLLLMGATGPNTPTLISLLTFIYDLPLITTYPIYILVLLGGVANVSSIWLWLGFIVVGVTIIIFGATFISVREGLESPGLSTATGVLFIISGIFLFGIILLPWLAAFILFVAFIMAALVFYGSREMD
ncbi:MAG: hypothetical protein WED07_13280 [Candidatus Freyarchaeum deiterrae]